MGFAVDADGTVGLRRHRSHDIVPVDRCPIATDGVNDVRRALGVVEGGPPDSRSWPPRTGERPVVLVDTGKHRIDGLPALDAGLVWKGRTLRPPDHVAFEVDGNHFEVGAGVFWQVHPHAAATLTRVVLEGLEPRPGERVADLYAGAGLFTVALARAVGPAGSVVAVERSGPAVADLGRNTAGLDRVEVLRAGVTPGVVTRRLGRPDLVVLDPARAGAGPEVMAALVGLTPPPRRIAYVSCEPAPFARDLAGGPRRRMDV